jgi:ABC-type lipoprotein release transport system permease subunit
MPVQFFTILGSTRLSRRPETVMHAAVEIARSGLAALLVHPGRSAATIAALLAALVPYLVGLGLSKGIEKQAIQSARFGADLYVTSHSLGRETPVPLAVALDLRRLDGVSELVPRIVGEVVLGKEQFRAVLVGVPVERFPSALHCVRGKLYGPGPRNQLVIGTELARRLNLDVASLIPPFYHSSEGDRISEIVGVFESDVPIWEANLIVTSFDTATTIFDQRGLATDLLVYCRPGYQQTVRSGILRASPSLSVTTREDLLALLPQGLLHREGVFNLLFVVVFVVAILVVLVTSGFGLAERRREVGILKAVGWQTDQVLFRCLVESLALSVAASALAVIGAFVWLKVFNGYGVASVFLAGAGLAPSFRVPFRIVPVPVLLAFVLALVVVLTGSLYSTWRAAVTPPREAMR